MTTALRHRHVRLLQDVLAALDGQAVRLPEWSADEVESTGDVSGVLPLADALGLFDGADGGVRDVVARHCSVTAAGAERLRGALPLVVDALNDDAVPHVVVGDAAMVTDVWSRPECRPVSSIEIVVAHHVFDRAAAVVERCAAVLPAGLAVVLHDGWREPLHGFDAEGFAVEPATFDHAALTTHTIGRLSAEVVRGGVRGVSMVDVWGCVHRAADWPAIADLMAHCDARLTGPGLWFVHRLVPDLLPEGLLASQLARLPERAHEELHEHHALDVLLHPAHEPSVAWSTAFAETLRERKAVVRDRMQPHPHDPDLRR